MAAVQVHDQFFRRWRPAIISILISPQIINRQQPRESYMKTCHSTKIKALLWCLAALAGLQVSARGNTLINRYSFNETSGIIATDSVSSANATLLGGTEG